MDLEVLETARRMLRRRTYPSEEKLHRNFGLHLRTIVAVWVCLNRRPQRARYGRTPVYYVLYTLYFLRRYPKEELLLQFGDASRFRRVVWGVIARLPRVLPKVACPRGVFAVVFFFLVVSTV
jgi:hypothetical protein